VAARAAAQRFPDWAYVELPDAGHVPHMEAATDVYQITMDWLSERGAR
jgi:pimeloyl-ACP methyl ester carboxylesterase